LKKIDVAPPAFFSDKIKRKKLVALEFARITHEIKLLNRFYSLYMPYYINPNVLLQKIKYCWNNKNNIQQKWRQ